MKEGQCACIGICTVTFNMDTGQFILIKYRIHNMLGEARRLSISLKVENYKS